MPRSYIESELTGRQEMPVPGGTFGVPGGGPSDALVQKLPNTMPALGQGNGLPSGGFAQPAIDRTPSRGGFDLGGLLPPSVVPRPGGFDSSVIMPDPNKPLHRSGFDPAAVFAANNNGSTDPGGIAAQTRVYDQFADRHGMGAGGLSGLGSMTRAPGGGSGPMGSSGNPIITGNFDQTMNNFVTAARESATNRRNNHLEDRDMGVMVQLLQAMGGMNGHGTPGSSSGFSASGSRSGSSYGSTGNPALDIYFKNKQALEDMHNKKAVPGEFDHVQGHKSALEQTRQQMMAFGMDPGMLGDDPSGIGGTVSAGRGGSFGRPQAAPDWREQAQKQLLEAILSRVTGGGGQQQDNGSVGFGQAMFPLPGQGPSILGPTGNIGNFRSQLPSSSANVHPTPAAGSQVAPSFATTKTAPSHASFDGSFSGNNPLDLTSLISPQALAITQAKRLSQAVVDRFPSAVQNVGSSIAGGLRNTGNFISGLFGN